MLKRQPHTPRAEGRPNVLILTCDQIGYPRFSYGPNAGFNDALNRILGFIDDLGDDNPYLSALPGFARLRKGAWVFRNHHIASSACTPSRATIYTGQYSTRTGVTQTDGLFKSGESPNFPWLAESGPPTLGAWMRAGGYDTAYFGKWHVSNPPDHSLERYGFSHWEESWPEPHGSLNTNLGVYRDIGFTDQAVAFIRGKAMGLPYARKVGYQDHLIPDGPQPNTESRPWLAVLSLTNPHDIATYPGVISQAMPTPDSDPNDPTAQSPFGSLTVPLQGQRSLPPNGGTAAVPLNKTGFSTDGLVNATPSQDEDLSTKPTCQREYAYKMGLALASKIGVMLPNITGQGRLGVQATLKSCIPFALADDPNDACLKFLEIYAWLHTVVDPHINRVLDVLEETGLDKTTMVVFLGDHGEYAGAHGMMIEKWHTAYNEATHVPFLVRPQTPNLDAGPVTVSALTSHIDVVPTVLGLAGFDQDEREKLAAWLSQTHDCPALPGADLSGLVGAPEGEVASVREGDGTAREGILFITDDEITAPLPSLSNAHNRSSDEQFEFFGQVVDAVIEGVRGTPAQPWMSPGAVCQPNHVRSARTTKLKLNKYFDPAGVEGPQWELYDLEHDPNEMTNLVNVTGETPTARSGAASWANTQEVQAWADEMLALLGRLEDRML